MDSRDWLIVIFMFGVFGMVGFGLWIEKTDIDVSKAVASGQLTHNGRLYIVRPAKVVEE